MMRASPASIVTFPMSTPVSGPSPRGWASTSRPFRRFITADAAARIWKAHPSVEAAAVVGKAYDTLFKELCSAQALLTPEGRQVLAPFAFVSALAGVLLVVELLRSNHCVAATNYWSVDPWGTPIGRLRRLRPRVPDCEFCADDDVRRLARALWSRSAEVF